MKNFVDSTSSMAHVMRFVLTLFPNKKILDWFKLKAFADDKIDVNKKLKFGMERIEYIVRKCWLPAFSPFPTLFSKGFFFKVVKSWAWLVKG